MPSSPNHSKNATKTLVRWLRVLAPAVVGVEAVIVHPLCEMHISCQIPSVFRRQCVRMIPERKIADGIARNHNLHSPVGFTPLRARVGAERACVSQSARSYAAGRKALSDQ